MTKEGEKDNLYAYPDFTLMNVDFNIMSVAQTVHFSSGKKEEDQ